MFIRSPATISKMSRAYSRSRNPLSMTVVAPSSRPNVAIATRCEEIRLTSIIMTRMTSARSGIWSVMPSSFSTARQYAVSLKIGAR
jgi:hypothetical protein